MKTSGKRCVVGNVLFAMQFIAKHTPLYFWMKILSSVVNSLHGFAQRVLIIKILLDMILSGSSCYDMLWLLLMFLGITILISIFDKYISEHIIPTGQEKLNARMNRILYDKAIALDLACYDMPEFYNDFVWGVSEANPKMNAILNNFAELIYRVTTVILTGALFVALDWLGLVFVSVYAVLGLILSKNIKKNQFALDTKMLPEKRKADYINRVFYLPDYAKEIRLFRMAERLKNDLYKVNTKINELLKRYNTKIFLMSFVNDFLAGTLFMRGLYLVYLIYLCTVKRVIGFGDIIALFYATERFFFTVREITEFIPELLANSLYIGKMRRFLERKPVIKSGRLSVPDEPWIIEFDSVTFTYDDEPVLKNVSLTIKSGEKIAIVGYNGAGKTTLVKLLMRLYDPTEGEIRLNGVNLKEYDLKQYRRKIGAVFQDYQIFAATLYDNVVMDITKKDKERVKESLLQSGFSATMPLETPLTKEFMDNGVNLSGGEAQKVAIARVLFKSAKLLILDEPSSALDPVSEYNIYKAMYESSEGKTVIFISHRLASTKMADKIYMFENGQIIEAADHNTLMRNNGKYAEMFRLQAERYIISH